MYNSRSARTRRLITTISILFVLVGLVLSGGTVAYAGYKSTEVVYAWDEAVSRYQNSNVVITFDGGWVPIFHPMNTFDNNIYPTDYMPFDPAPPAEPSDACPGVTGSTTEYAGIMEFGLYHTDNSPLGAEGFVQTKDWQIVSCDRNDDGTFNNADLALAPGTANMDPVPGVTFQVLSVDAVKPCTTGNCENEIVTTIYVNFDANCDGVLDTQPAGGLCFYAQAQTTTDLRWEGPLQARISAGGGDKTVNFSPQDPTAVTLLSFAGKSPVVRYGVVLAVLGIFGLAALAASNRLGKLNLKRH